MSTSGAAGVTVAYDYIQVYKTLVLACGLSVKGVFEDPKVRSSVNIIYQIMMLYRHRTTVLMSSQIWSYISC